jgi:hypothetical protein
LTLFHNYVFIIKNLAMKFENLGHFAKEVKPLNILVIAGNKALVTGLEVVLKKTFPRANIEVASNLSVAQNILAISAESDFDLILLSRSPRFEDEKSKKGMDLIPYLQRFRKNACLMFLYTTENSTGDVLLQREEIDLNIGASELHEVLQKLC